VKVSVDHIADALQKKLRVGMSVRVEVDLDRKPMITVPIKALQRNKGKTQVKVYDPETKKTRWVDVKPGKTSIKTVGVLKGLNVGDHILVND